MGKDVLIYADPDDVDHKLAGNVPDGHYCYWTLPVTPQQTEPGSTVLFSDGQRVHARGTIRAIEDQELQFEPLQRIDKPTPTEPPTRGFTYIDPESMVDAAGIGGERA